MILLASAFAVAVVVHLRLRALKRAQAMQRAFANQLLVSQEAERKRIAAELHDSLGHRLVLVNNLALFSLRGQQGDMTDPKRVRWLEEIRNETSLAIEETRQISYNLRPIQLDRWGLTKAIGSLINKTAAASAIKFETEIDNIDDAFETSLRINVYRIIQECLNNVVKHSGASEASVAIVSDQHEVNVTVRDNGRGLSRRSATTDTTGGFGLLGIAERAHLMNGRIELQSLPNQGTSVVIVLPLTPEI